MAIKVYIVYWFVVILISLGSVIAFLNSSSTFPSVAHPNLHLVKVPETLTIEELGALRAPPKSDAPIITPDQLHHADGFVFGFPTRFGMIAAQFQAFLDSTRLLWEEELLQGKPAGIFFSTGCQGGGQETTALTAIPQLVNHGVLFVPIGFTPIRMFETEEVRGGSPYGAGTYAGTNGSRKPSKIELRQAFCQGKCIATITKKLKR
ncbi:NAD(P)H dehydrogenase (quinone) FQR1 [Spatholobus suberectus]|nr:NAD(P)H dehydrogenase (quinone) FQR1 [Spatholobus suberectus]